MIRLAQIFGKTFAVLAGIMKKTRTSMNWDEFDQMNDEERRAAAEAEPDGAAKAYLKVIAREPELVRRALEQS